MPDPKLLAIDTAALPWEERFNEHLGKTLYRKNLITDPDTGMEVRIVKYPAGVINKLTPQIPVYFVATPFLIAGGMALFYFIGDDILALFIAALSDLGGS